MTVSSDHSSAPPPLPEPSAVANEPPDVVDAALTDTVTLLEAVPPAPLQLSVKVVLAISALLV